VSVVHSFLIGIHEVAPLNLLCMSFYYVAEREIQAKRATYDDPRDASALSLPARRGAAGAHLSLTLCTAYTPVYTTRKKGRRVILVSVDFVVCEPSTLREMVDKALVLVVDLYALGDFICAKPIRISERDRREAAGRVKNIITHHGEEVRRAPDVIAHLIATYTDKPVLLVHLMKLGWLDPLGAIVILKELRLHSFIVDFELLTRVVAAYDSELFLDNLNTLLKLTKKMQANKNYEPHPADLYAKDNLRTILALFSMSDPYRKWMPRTSPSQLRRVPTAPVPASQTSASLSELPAQPRVHIKSEHTRAAHKNTADEAVRPKREHMQASHSASAEAAAVAPTEPSRKLPVRPLRDDGIAYHTWVIRRVHSQSLPPSVANTYDTRFPAPIQARWARIHRTVVLTRRAHFNIRRRRRRIAHCLPVECVHAAFTVAYAITRSRGGDNQTSLV
jgi:hypothetical protein